MLTIFLVGIFGSIIAAVIGTFWYSNATPMGKIHLQYIGFDKLSKEEQKKKMEEGKSMMPKMYAGQMLLSLLTAFEVAAIVIQDGRSGVAFGMSLGFVIFNWLCFMVPIIGSGVLWGNCDPKIAWKKFFSDIFCNLATVLAVAVVAMWFI